MVNFTIIIIIIIIIIAIIIPRNFFLGQNALYFALFTNLCLWRLNQNFLSLIFKWKRARLEDRMKYRVKDKKVVR